MNIVQVNVVHCTYSNYLKLGFVCCNDLAFDLLTSAFHCLLLVTVECAAANFEHSVRQTFCSGILPDQTDGWGVQYIMWPIVGWLQWYKILHDKRLWMWL